MNNKWRVTEAFIAELESHIKSTYFSLFKQPEASNQRQHTPAKLVVEILEAIETVKDKDVLVIANSDVLHALMILSKYDQKYKDEFDYKSLTFLTDVKGLERDWYNKITVDNLNEPAKIDMMGKKFDVVIGNPPWSVLKEKNEGELREKATQLYPQFVQLGLDVLNEGGKLAMVMPSSWCGKTNSIANKLILSNGLKIARSTRWAWPETGEGKVVTASCWVLCEPGYTGDIDINESIISRSVIEESKMVPIKCDVDELNVFNFIKSQCSSNLGSLWSHPQLWSSNDSAICEAGNVDIITITGAKGLAPTVQQVVANDDQVKSFPHFNKWKVISNWNGGIGSIGCVKVEGPNKLTATNVMSWGVDSEEQANNLVSYLESTLVSFLVRMIKQVQCNSHWIYKLIPSVDLNQSWTDEKLFELFNLSEEQIKTVKYGALTDSQKAKVCK